MPHETKVAHFDITHTRYLSEHSELEQPLPAFASPDTLIELLRLMTLTREFDQQVINLQRTGQMGTYPSCQGAEAFGVGIGHALHQDDVLCPYYREQGALIQRHTGLSGLLLYWGGNELGSNQHNNDQDFPVSVPIASQCLHATGIAYAFKYRQQQRAVVVTIGDGGTSEGDFYEAINVAGAWKLPVVFVINNNQWAISVPLSQQTACETIAQKAIAAGIPGKQVDGNDVIAVSDSVKTAIDHARQGLGPTLIEALTYRLSDHTTADDATRYQPQDAMKQAFKKEPLSRLLQYLLQQKHLTESDYETMQKNCRQEVDLAIQQYLDHPKSPPTSAFDFLYEQLPEAYTDQYHSLGETA